MNRTLIKIDKNGSKHYEQKCTCDRCGGDGMYKWGAVINGVPQYMGTCFKCEGAGWVFEKVIERTPEYQAKLDARRQAKLEANAKKHEESRKQAEEERLARQAELEAKKKISQFVGKVGERLNLTLTYIHTASFDVKSFSGYGTDRMHIHILKDAEGNTFTWKTGHGLGMDVSKNEYITWKSAEEGQTVVLKGTVKEHNEYNGEKQTVLTRCKVNEIR